LHDAIIRSDSPLEKDKLLKAYERLCWYMAHVNDRVAVVPDLENKLAGAEEYSQSVLDWLDAGGIELVISSLLEEEAAQEGDLAEFRA